MKKSVFVFLCCMVFLTFEAEGTWAAQMWCVSNAADLQTALNNAVSINEGINVVMVDNVVMVVQGTYKGNFAYNSNSGMSITLQGGYTKGCVSRVFNPAKTVLDGNHAGGVLFLEDRSGGNISVEGFTIRNGNTTGSGGGVDAESSSTLGPGGTITLSGNTFTGNTAANGGGVYAKSSSSPGTGGTITLTENTFTGNYAYYGGGGVDAESTSGSGLGGPITLTWNTFTGNTADDGGGVYAESGGPTGSGQIYFYENTITKNYAYADGGGVFADTGSGTGGAITLTGNTVTGNYAYDEGGGVYASSDSDSGTGGVSLIGNTITANYAYTQGGGVWASSYSASGTGGVVSLTGNTITGNYAYQSGGGVYASSNTSSGTVGATTLAQNTISGNTAYGATGGAGVHIFSNSNSGTGGTITLTGNTVANNHAYSNGGGVYCELYAYSSGSTGAVTFEANTITGNIANGGYGGISVGVQASSGARGPVTFTNNIIAANTASEIGGVYAYSSSSSGPTGAITLTNNTITKNIGVFGTGGVEVNMSNNTFNCYNNIIWGNTSPSIADISFYGTSTAYGYNNDYGYISGSWNGESGKIDADPLFDGFGYYHLTPVSPCIDAGYVSTPGLPATDIDGNTRIIGAAVDIGAVEYNGLVIAKAPADSSVFADDSIIDKYQPTFQWIAVEPFKSFAILFSTSATDFSTKGVFITQGSTSGTTSSWTPPIATWEKIMAISYNGGGVIRPIYWKVVGTETNNSTADTPVRQFSVGSASQPTILSPAYGTTLPAADNPTFVFLTGYNIKFRLEIWSLADTTKIITYTYTVTNPIATPVLEEMLSSSQWTAVKKLIGTNIGNFRIRAWDGINRESDSGTQPFTIR